MPDNWIYVFAAYGLAAAVLTAYWRHLARRERELAAVAGRRGAGGRRAAAAPAGAPASDAAAPMSSGSRTVTTSTARDGDHGQAASSSGHPRGGPATRPPRR